MWAAWTSLSSLTSHSTSSASPTESAASVAAVLATSPAVAHPSQRCLFSAVSRRANEKWLSLKSSTPTRQAAAIAVGTAVTMLIGAAVVRGSIRHSRSSGGSKTNIYGSGQYGDDQTTQTDSTASICIAAQAEDMKIHNNAGGSDEIEFIDPAESAFNTYVRCLKRENESVLLRAISQLEAAAAEVKAVEKLARQSNDAQDASDDADQNIAQQRAKLQRAAVVADELFTQYICSLDGVPVREQDKLKQRRKELVLSAGLLHQRIAPYLHPTTAETEFDAM